MELLLIAILHPQQAAQAGVAKVAGSRTRLTFIAGHSRRGPDGIDPKSLSRPQLLQDMAVAK